MGIGIGINLALRRLGAGAIAYLLRDEFTTDRAAGSVNGTAAEPGPGTRTVVDTGNRISVTGGELSISGGEASIWRPNITYGAITVVPGLIISFRAKTGTTRGPDAIGLNTSLNAEGYRSVFRFVNSNLGVPPTIAGAEIRVAACPVGSYATCRITTRAAGNYYFAKVGSETNMLLVYVDSFFTGNGDLSAGWFSGTSVVDYLRIPIALWLPAPIASDGFASAFGITDGLGHAEGVAGGIGSGGGGVTWTQQVGTWTVASNRASASALSGGIAIATVPTSTADVLADVKVTRSAGQGGLVLRYQDANNYLYANHDGTNAFLKQVLAGVTTTLITAAATYSANAVLRCDLSGVAGRLYYNNALVGSTASINAALTATAHGLYVTDVTANLTLDDFRCFAKGTSGEYAALDAY